MTRYALAGHVFICLEGEHVVFLDVRQDRYFALEAARTAELAARVAGWPVAATSTPPASNPPAGEAAARSAVVTLLLERGFLSDDVGRGKDATPVSIGAPTDEYASDDADREPLNATVVGRFIVSVLTASAVLKFRPLERVLARVARRHQAAECLPSPFASQRAAGAQAQVGAFAFLRPFFFTSKNACLFEALALGEFLAPYGLHPRWVFGVQARPFAAHCWLQLGDIVLNDTVDHVSRYTPILVV